MVLLFFTGDKNTKICAEASKRFCDKTLQKIIEISSTKTYLEECNCLPPCTSIEYKLKIDNVKFDMMAIKNITKLKDNIMKE